MQRRVGVLATIALSLMLALLAVKSPTTVPAPGQDTAKKVRPVRRAAGLVGVWRLNTARTHYGPGVERRRHELFTCTEKGDRTSCTIVSEREDGRAFRGEFSATLDGTGAAVSGMPGVNEVRLREVAADVVDATFLQDGRAVFGYRAFRGSDGLSLTIVSVDPASRAALTTVVVYDRR